MTDKALERARKLLDTHVYYASFQSATAEKAVQDFAAAMEAYAQEKVREEREAYSGLLNALRAWAINQEFGGEMWFARITEFLYDRGLLEIARAEGGKGEK